MTTPTPGDLSARLLAYATRKAKARDALGVPAGDYVGQEEIDTLCQAAAALSALPAAGGAVAWRNHDAAIDAKALATAQEIALMWVQDRSQFVSRIQVAVIDAMRWFDAATTPQPSAAEDYESWAKQERQREDTATRLGSAAVGAQGDVELAWQNIENAEAEFLRNLADKGGLQPLVSGMLRHCARLLDRPAAPAAGKGVDERTRFIAWANQRGMVAFDCEAAFGMEADDRFISPDTSLAWTAWQAALTRQPVAGESHCVACGESSCKGINFCEPAATPTDGGEGS